MDMKKYFKEVNEYLDNLTDEEFNKLLEESGVERCPIISTTTITSSSFAAGLYDDFCFYKESNSFNFFTSNLEVAA